MIVFFSHPFDLRTVAKAPDLLGIELKTALDGNQFNFLLFISNISSLFH